MTAAEKAYMLEEYIDSLQDRIEDMEAGLETRGFCWGCPHIKAVKYRTRAMGVDYVANQLICPGGFAPKEREVCPRHKEYLASAERLRKAEAVLADAVAEYDAACEAEE